MDTLPDRVLAALKRAGMNRKEASLKAGLSETYARDLLKSKSQNPRMDHLRRFAAVLNVDPDELMYGAASADARVARLLRAYADLDCKQQDMLIAFAEMVSGTAKAVEDAGRPGQATGVRSTIS